MTLFVPVGFTQGTASETKTNYAVVNLKCSSGVTEGEGELITDRLRSELFNTGIVNVMERNQMQEILKEQGFQQSGACTDEACLVEMGQMLGVKILVVGSLGKLGSMFMVNIRAIDVQTAQIVKVVSVDIKGDIEEVVEHLREIARKLTGIDADGSTVAEAAPTAEPVEQVAPSSETVAVEAPQEEVKGEKEEVEAKVAAPSDERTEKNRNRGGVGLTYNLFGNVRHIKDGEFVKEVILTLDSYSGNLLLVDEESSTRTTTPCMDYLLRFYIRVGKFINIEVGPHFLYSDETYTFNDIDYPSELFISYSIPGVHTGVSFVKRFFPLKINAGVFVNIDVPIVYYMYDGYDPYGDSFNNDAVNILFRFVPGIRSGAEIMAGSHVGFNVDFLFQWMNLDMDFDFDELDTEYNSEDPYYTQEILFPLIGLGLGVNFYF